MLVSAIDPEQEDALVALSDTVVQGRPLREGMTTSVLRDGAGGEFGASVPALISTRTYTDVSMQIAVSRVTAPPGGFADLLTTRFDSNGPPMLVSPNFAPLRALPTTPVQTLTLSAQQLYDATLTDSAGGLFVTGYWSAGQITYTPGPAGALVPEPQTNDERIWIDGLSFNSWADVPPENQDTAYRVLTPHVATRNNIGNGGSQLNIVGRFDPDLLPGFDPLTALPLETYNPPVAAPVDQASRQALAGGDYVPTRNLAGYLAQPPFLLTTIDALPTLLPFFDDSDQATPISVIRVRVTGSAGVDENSLRRIEAVATLIREQTGLQVDVTAGSSPQPQRINVPASAQGTPALQLEENWVRKGVVLTILAAVDRKSVLLLGLVLLVAAAFLLNAGIASVRSRRAELGLLLATGWSRRHLFTAVLAELITVGLLAGTAGTAVAFAVSAVLGLSQPAWQLLLVAPVAVGLTALAGLMPALLATRGQAMDALTPPQSHPKRTRHVHSVTTMATGNIRRNLGRTLLSGSCIVVATAALALLASISLAFQGNLIGTLLGDVIVVQVRAADYVTVALILGLSALALADVMTLTTRERAVELVTLRVTGWTDRTLLRLILTEGLSIGVLGSLTGAAVGVAAGAALGADTTSVLTAAAISALTGLAITALSAAAPAAAVARLPIGVASAEA